METASSTNTADSSRTQKPSEGVSWESFIRGCAINLLAGKLTTQHLREALKHPRIRSSADRYDFRLSVIQLCEEIRPLSSQQQALIAEVDAADRRFRNLVKTNDLVAATSIRPAAVCI